VSFVDTNLYTATSGARHDPIMAPKSKNPKVLESRTLPQSCPEALGSPTGYVVRPGQCLLWPHPSHSPPAAGLFSSSFGHQGDEWVPNLSRMSVRACRPQYPGGPIGCVRLFLPRPQWSSPHPQRLDVRMPRQLVHAWRCNEADSGSLALRPARWLALHQQGHVLPSFRRLGRPRRRRLSLHRHIVNSYGRTCTGKTCGRMGCERMKHGGEGRRLAFPQRITQAVRASAVRGPTARPFTQRRAQPW
jgi:hypothetical protein